MLDAKTVSYALFIVELLSLHFKFIKLSVAEVPDWLYLPLSVVRCRTLFDIKLELLLVYFWSSAALR